MQLTRLRLRESVNVESAGNNTSVLTRQEGWDLKVTADGVMATKGDLGVWVPLASCVFGNFEVETKKTK